MEKWKMERGGFEKSSADGIKFFALSNADTGVAGHPE